jgi:hypothetical protein
VDEQLWPLGRAPLRRLARGCVAGSEGKDNRLWPAYLPHMVRCNPIGTHAAKFRSSCSDALLEVFRKDGSALTVSEKPKWRSGKINFEEPSPNVKGSGLDLSPRSRLCGKWSLDKPDDSQDRSAR